MKRYRTQLGDHSKLDRDHDAGDGYAVQKSTKAVRPLFDRWYFHIAEMLNSRQQSGRAHRRYLNADRWPRDRRIQGDDQLWCHADQKHWHGATPATAMTHIASQESQDGSPVTWLDHVTDEQYLAGPTEG